MLLSDLTFIDDGNPDTLGEESLNWNKYLLYHKVLSEFTEQQRRCNYSFAPDPVRYFLEKDMSAIEDMNMNKLYDLSLEQEPRDSSPH